MKFQSRIAIMAGVHDLKKNKHNSISPNSEVIRKYNAKVFNNYLNKLVLVKNIK